RLRSFLKKKLKNKGLPTDWKEMCENYFKIKEEIVNKKSDIDSFRADDLISVSIARPTNSVHIVNCPFIDPFQ
ncbi:MAG: hypothetical protein QQN65_02200, partial [Nitrosopumilus sp.]